MSKFKRYERYKDSGVEWIGEIPENWEGKSLRHVIKFIRNGTTATQIDESEYVVTRIETISSGKIDLDKVGYVDYFKDIQKYKLDKGDILFSHINSLAMVGNCAIYDFDINLYNGMNLLQIRPSDDVCKKWLLYFLKSYYFNQSVKAIAKHAINQVSVPVNRLKEVRIFEPSIDEQYSIANFLDQKTAEIDGLIADKEKLIELLQEKRQAVITEAVTKGLNPNVRMKDSGIEWIGEIPEHWEVASFTKYISSIVDYRGKTPEKVDEGVFLVTAKNIKNGRIDYSLSQEYVKTEEYAQIMRRGLPEIGDVLFTTEAPLGEVANVDRTDIALAQRVIKFRGKEMQLDNYYLKYWIMSHGFQHDLQSYATGSTATGIKASKLSKLIILLPIFEEQKAIAYFLDKKTSEIDELISNIRVQIEKLKEYRQSLISEAVTGKIDVRDYANN